MNYKKLGGYIRQIDLRNSDASLGEDSLYGISVTKEFIVSHANLVGVTFDSYKVVAPRQFAYIPDTSRRGDKIAISLNSFGENIIVSSICSVFEIIDENQLLPEYLMLWFMRPEFDRYARFMSNGSAREVFDWDCMCGVELPVPPIFEQRKIVHDYQVITDRIELLRKMNENLEEQSFLLFDESIKGCTDTKPLYEFGEVLTGKTPPTENAEYYGNDVPFIKTPDMHGNLYIVSWESSLSKLGADSQANKYIPADSVIVSCIGANAGEVSLTSCLAQTNQQINAVITQYSKYLYCALKKSRDELRALGDAGSTMININKTLFENFRVVSLDSEKLDVVERKLKPLFMMIKNNLKEMDLLTKLASYIMNNLAVSM
ncbi:MAG: restriction endonuclease subunit S [Synergistaceae bacterium]|nr:restriction endonuclease subunit S [Synergistaceae bacterium]